MWERGKKKSSPTTVNVGERKLMPIGERELVPYKGLDVPLYQLLILVPPLRFRVGEQGKAEAGFVFVPIAQAMAGANHVARTHRREVGVDLAAVHPASSLGTPQPV